MEIRYQLTEADFNDALIAHRNKVTFKKWSLRLFGTIMLLVLAFAIFGVLTDHTGKAFSNFAPLFVVIMMWALLLYFWPKLAARTQFRKQPAVQGMRTVSIGASGIQSNWNDGSANVEWKNYVRLVESPTEFLLYTSPGCFGILPKRAFSVEQANEFRALAAANIPQHR